MERNQVCPEIRFVVHCDHHFRTMPLGVELSTRAVVLEATARDLDLLCHQCGGNSVGFVAREVLAVVLEGKLPATLRQGEVTVCLDSSCH